MLAIVWLLIGKHNTIPVSRYYDTFNVEWLRKAQSITQFSLIFFAAVTVIHHRHVNHTYQRSSAQNYRMVDHSNDVRAPVDTLLLCHRVLSMQWGLPRRFFLWTHCKRNRQTCHMWRRLRCYCYRWVVLGIKAYSQSIDGSELWTVSSYQCNHHCYLTVI